MAWFMLFNVTFNNI